MIYQNQHSQAGFVAQRLMSEKLKVKQNLLRLQFQQNYRSNQNYNQKILLKLQTVCDVCGEPLTVIKKEKRRKLVIIPAQVLES